MDFGMEKTHTRKVPPSLQHSNLDIPRYGKIKLNPYRSNVDVHCDTAESMDGMDKF